MNTRIVFLVSFLAINLSSIGQFKKGDRMIGSSIASMFYNSGNGEVTFPSSSGYESKNTSYGIRLEPSIGWFISETTAVGASLFINPSGNKARYESGGTTFQEDKSSRFDIGLGSFGRHYFSDGNSFMPYGQFGFNLGISSNNTEGFRYYDATVDYKTVYDGNSSGGFFANAALQLGLTKMLGENAGLDIFAGYSYSYSKNTMKTTTTTDVGINGSIDLTEIGEPTTKFTNHGVMVGIGFQVFLRKK